MGPQGVSLSFGLAYFLGNRVLCPFFFALRFFHVLRDRAYARACDRVCDHATRYRRPFR